MSKISQKSETKLRNLRSFNKNTNEIQVHLPNNKNPIQKTQQSQRKRSKVSKIGEKKQESLEKIDFLVSLNQEQATPKTEKNEVLTKTESSERKFSEFDFSSGTSPFVSSTNSSFLPSLILEKGNSQKSNSKIAETDIAMLALESEQSGKIANSCSQSQGSLSALESIREGNTFDIQLQLHPINALIKDFESKRKEGEQRKEASLQLFVEAFSKQIREVEEEDRMSIEQDQIEEMDEDQEEEKENFQNFNISKEFNEQAYLEKQNICKDKEHKSFEFVPNALQFFYPKQVKKQLLQKKMSTNYDKVVQGIKFPVGKQKQEKALQKMKDLTSCQLNFMKIILSKVDRKSKSIKKKEKIVSENLKNKRVYLDQENFDILNVINPVLTAAHLQNKQVSQTPSQFEEAKKDNNRKNEDQKLIKDKKQKRKELINKKSQIMEREQEQQQQIEINNKESNLSINKEQTSEIREQDFNNSKETSIKEEVCLQRMDSMPVCSSSAQSSSSKVIISLVNLTENSNNSQKKCGTRTPALKKTNSLRKNTNKSSNQGISQQPAEQQIEQLEQSKLENSQLQIKLTALNQLQQQEQSINNNFDSILQEEDFVKQERNQTYNNNNEVQYTPITYQSSTYSVLTNHSTTANSHFPQYFQENHQYEQFDNLFESKPHFMRYLDFSDNNQINYLPYSGAFEEDHRNQSPNLINFPQYYQEYPQYQEIGQQQMLEVNNNWNNQEGDMANNKEQFMKDEGPVIENENTYCNQQIDIQFNLNNEGNNNYFSLL